MRTTSFDGFSGISGDMTIGALIDAGLSVKALHAELATLPVEGCERSVATVKRHGFGGTTCHVEVGDASPSLHLSPAPGHHCSLSSLKSGSCRP
jgi:uncharacterized protein (DUF111 family)